jgi:hypothetical protein
MALNVVAYWRLAGSPDYTTEEKASQYEATMPLLEAMFREFQDLAKKKPEGVLNKNKVKIANRLLADVLAVLDGEPNRGYLELFDEDDLPQNSDAVLMLSQVVAAMERFKARYHGGSDVSFRWATKPGRGARA